MGKVNHVALNVSQINWYVEFFDNAFGMKVFESELDDGQLRQVWIEGGLQLINNSGSNYSSSSPLAHIALEVDDLPGAIGKVIANGGTTMAKGDNWLEIPGGICLELLDNRAK